MKQFIGACLLLSLLTVMSACSTVRAPVTAREEAQQQPVTVPSSAARQPDSQRGAGAQHEVVRGDTMYSIAWRYGYDYKALAAWNRIKPPYTIYPGQVIRLLPTRSAGALQPPPLTAKKPRKPARPDAATPKATPSTPAPVAAGATTTAGGVRWQWPARGKLLKSTALTAKKGIIISGQAGQKIVAAATGEVVYSGNSLRGYGNLIIIKHDDTYLSAYAHNRDLVVKEGEAVRGGQQIATMGVDSKGAPVLHFEIRKNGKPVDPLRQLPGA